LNTLAAVQLNRSIHQWIQCIHTSRHAGQHNE